MTKDVRVIPFDSDVKEAARIMRDEDIGAIPVEKDNKMVGMVTDRDLTIRVLADGKDVDSAKVNECMSEGVKYCFDDEEFEDVAKNMADLQIRRMPVVNRDKRLVGILSLGDLATHEKSHSASHHALKEISS